ncbi:hypothetical protein B0H63DRAFT_385279 [Podospora didyma]|uniref:Uncharacterized protein n=1 Tax=Podospora didyma TaxID=330526 RepID=A0AAE0P8W9_9PEZI|nr:hypothetical protein B0H63DRAFT_385279 [Podospora didyma]
MHSAVAASIGARVLSEIDETSLDEILTSLRTGFATTTLTTANDGNDHPDDVSALLSTTTRLKAFPIPGLDGLVARHFRATQSAQLAVTGRYRELLYVLVATLIAPPHEKAVTVIDFDGRFDPARILATAVVEASTDNPQQYPRSADLDHVHILRPPRGGLAHIASCVASAQEYMLYGSHCSRSREWWGTVVIGGGLNPAGTASAAVSAHVAVTADWKGWLRVDRADVSTFWGKSVDEALADRDQRQAAVDDAGWVATSPWGSLRFGRRTPPG